MWCVIYCTFVITNTDWIEIHRDLFRSKPLRLPEPTTKDAQKSGDRRSRSRESGERSSSDDDSDDKVAQRKSVREERRRRSPAESSLQLRDSRTIVLDHRRQPQNNWRRSRSRDRGYQPPAWRRGTSDARRFGRDRRSRSGSRERRRDSRRRTSRSPVRAGRRSRSVSEDRRRQRSDSRDQPHRRRSPPSTNRIRRKSRSASPAAKGRGRSGSSERGRVGRGRDKCARSSSSDSSASSERRSARRGQKQDSNKSKPKKQNEVTLVCCQFYHIRLRIWPNLSSQIRPGSAVAGFETVKSGTTLIDGVGFLIMSYTP